MAVREIPIKIFMNLIIFVMETPCFQFSAHLIFVCICICCGYRRKNKKKMKNCRILIQIEMTDFNVFYARRKKNQQPGQNWNRIHVSAIIQIEAEKCLEPMQKASYLPFVYSGSFYLLPMVAHSVAVCAHQAIHVMQ